MKKTEGLHRARSKLVKSYGQWYFQKMSPEEWATKVDKFIEVHDIRGEKALAEFMARVQTKRDPYDTVQYRIYLLPNYAENEGAIVIKVHHCMSDGLGFAAFLSAVSDDYDVKSLPALKPLPTWKQWAIWLAYPLITPPMSWKIMTKTKDRNAI